MGPGAGELLDNFRKSHLPTGRIALEDVIRLLIEDLGVKPRRDDWSDVLDAARARYETWRTWSGSSDDR